VRRYFRQLAQADDQQALSGKSSRAVKQHCFAGIGPEFAAGENRLGGILESRIGAKQADFRLAICGLAGSIGGKNGQQIGTSGRRGVLSNLDFHDEQALPDYFDPGVAVEDAISGDDGQFLDESRGKDYAIKGIAVMLREREHLDRVLRLKRQKRDAQIFNGTLRVIVIHFEFAR
jgi:hypothetical protein